MRFIHIALLLSTPYGFCYPAFPGDEREPANGTDWIWMQELIIPLRRGGLRRQPTRPPHLASPTAGKSYPQPPSDGASAPSEDQNRGAVADNFFDFPPVMDRRPAPGPFWGPGPERQFYEPNPGNGIMDHITFWPGVDYAFNHNSNGSLPSNSWLDRISPRRFRKKETYGFRIAVDRSTGHEFNENGTSMGQTRDSDVILVDERGLDGFPTNGIGPAIRRPPKRPRDDLDASEEPKGKRIRLYKREE